MAVWIAVCILLAIFLSVLALTGLGCSVSPSDTGVSRLEAFCGFVYCSLFAGLFYIHVHHLVTKPQETPATRDIHLTVPEKVQVHTEFRLDNTIIGKEVL